MTFWLDINDLCMWFVEIHKNLHENAWMYLAAWNFISIWKNVLYKYFSRTNCVQTIFSFRLHIKSSCQCTLEVSTTWNSLVAKIKLFMHIYERTTYIHIYMYIYSIVQCRRSWWTQEICNELREYNLDIAAFRIYADLIASPNILIYITRSKFWT